MIQLELTSDLTATPWTPEEEEAMQQMLKNTNGISANDIQAGGSHYKDMSVQPWTVMEALLTHEEFVGFLKGNLIKYGMRQGKKDSPDAEKWHHYKMKLKEAQGK